MLHQRFEKHIDMIETHLRSMISYAVWTPHKWALCFHDYHRWTIKRLHNYSLCLTIPDSSKVRSPVSPYLVSTLLPTNPVYSFRVMRPREPVMHLQGYGHNSTEWAPEYLSFTWMDKSHYWSIPSTYSFQAPKTIHLYDRPVTVRRLMFSKYPSGGSDKETISQSLRKDYCVS